MNDCPICMDPYGLAETYIHEKCRIRVHLHCIEMWISRFDSLQKCPFCRHIVHVEPPTISPHPLLREILETYTYLPPIRWIGREKLPLSPWKPNVVCVEISKLESHRIPYAILPDSMRNGDEIPPPVFVIMDQLGDIEWMEWNGKTTDTEKMIHRETLFALSMYLKKNLDKKKRNVKLQVCVD